eukprot:2048799-Prymnesium_polylepis.1
METSTHLGWKWRQASDRAHLVSQVVSERVARRLDAVIVGVNTGAVDGDQQWHPWGRNGWHWRMWWFRRNLRRRRR